MSTPGSGRPRGVEMILALLQIATVPNAAIPMPIVFRMADVQLCWAICVPRATIFLYRTLIGYSAVKIAAITHPASGEKM